MRKNWVVSEGSVSEMNQKTARSFWSPFRVALRVALSHNFSTSFDSPTGAKLLQPSVSWTQRDGREKPVKKNREKPVASGTISSPPPLLRFHYLPCPVEFARVRSMLPDMAGISKAPNHFSETVSGKYSYWGFLKMSDKHAKVACRVREVPERVSRRALQKFLSFVWKSERAPARLLKLFPRGSCKGPCFPERVPLKGFLQGFRNSSWQSAGFLEICSQLRTISALPSLTQESSSTQNVRYPAPAWAYMPAGSRFHRNQVPDPRYLTAFPQTTQPFLKW